jgi:putative transposase
LGCAGRDVTSGVALEPARGYLDGMSRLRRPFLSDRYIFVTVNLLRSRSRLGDGDFERLAAAVQRMRAKHRFLLTAWVFLPDHWHAIFYPPHPLTISQIFKAVKVSSMISLNRHRRESGEVWQGRFFDHALRTMKDYLETVEYIHSNPVRRGLVERAEDWKWSSVREYSGASPEEQERRCGLTIDRVRLPADEDARI